MIDWKARNKLCAFMEESLSVQKAPDSMYAEVSFLLDETDDSTVWYAGDYFLEKGTEGCEKIDSKKTWDKMQRLLLLLESGGEIAPQSTPIVHVSQVIAFATLVVSAALGVASLLIWNQPSPVFWACWICAGFVAAGLYQWRTEVAKQLDDPDLIGLLPYSSTRAIVRVLKQTPEFHKQRFPRHQTEVETTADSMTGTHSDGWFFITLCCFLLGCVAGMWVFFWAPFMLLTQCFPIEHTKMLVGDPEETWLEGIAPDWDNASR